MESHKNENMMMWCILHLGQYLDQNMWPLNKNTVVLDWVFNVVLNTSSYALVKMSLDAHPSSVCQLLWNHHYSYFYVTLFTSSFCWWRQHTFQNRIFGTVKFNSTSKSWKLSFNMVLIANGAWFCLAVWITCAQPFWHITGIFLAFAQFWSGLSHTSFHSAQFWKIHGA